MEEPKLAPTTARKLTPQKRPLDQNARIQESNYFKMRAVLKNLRPHVIELLQLPEFRNCKAASEIQGQLKLLMDLYNEMTADTITPEKLRPSDRESMKPPENKPFFTGHISEKWQPEEVKMQGTYIVGGSSFGWNFITFPGTKPVYYGRTKVGLRSANAVPK